MERYSVSRVMGSELVRVGTLWRATRGMEQFFYAAAYLERGAAPLSLSLPLRTQDYVPTTQTTLPAPLIQTATPTQPALLSRVMPRAENQALSHGPGTTIPQRL